MDAPPRGHGPQSRGRGRSVPTRDQNQPDAPAARARGRARGRGRGRGRGQDASPTVDTQPTVQESYQMALEVQEKQRLLTKKRIAALSASQKKELSGMKRRKELHYQVIPGSVEKTSKLGLAPQAVRLLADTPNEKPADEPYRLRDPNVRISVKKTMAQTSRCQTMAQNTPMPNAGGVREGDGWHLTVPINEAFEPTAGLYSAPVQPTTAPSSAPVQPAAAPSSAPVQPAAAPYSVPVAPSSAPMQPAAGPSWAPPVYTGEDAQPVECTAGPAEPLFAFVINDHEELTSSSQIITIAEEVTIADQELLIGCDDGSDIEEDDIGDIDNLLGINFTGPVCISRLIDSAVEDAFTGSNVLAPVDNINDELLASLLANIDFDWTSDLTEFTGLREEFTGVPGPTFPVSELGEPVDCFLKMIEPHFVDVIVTETNNYATTTIRALDAAGKLSAGSRLRKWYPTTQREMYIFLALLIAQGLFPTPVEQGYWQGNSSMALFQRTMTYNRFILLKKFVHFTDNATLRPDMTLDEKRLHKIQPVINYFRKQFKQLYYPHQEVAIDESLLKWKGLLSFVQKISTKAAQVGLKTYELCDKNGYLWDFFYYTGSKDKLNRRDDQQISHDERQDVGHDAEYDVGHDAGNDETSRRMPPPSNATANIVIDLAKPLFGKGHTIVMDNFYNSPLLARYLKLNKTDCYGTLRLNRQNVPDSLRTLTRVDMNPGDVLSSNTKDVTVMVWRDTGLVSMISTYHKPDVGLQSKYGTTKYKPAIVLDYNKTMGGVDRKDQILSSQPMERPRNLIWYKKVFRRLFNTAIFNSYIIYLSKMPNISHRTYREQVMDGLLKRFAMDLQPERPVVTSNHVITVGRTAFMRVTVSHSHFPVRSGLKAGRCVWCTYRFKKSSRTLYKCRECDVNLCIDFCFENFHTPDK